MKLISKLFLLSISLMFCLSCDEEKTTDSENIVPEKFTVEIPSSLVKNALNSSIRQLDENDLNGGRIYEALGGFIYVAEVSGELIESIIGVIYTLGIDKAISFDFNGDDDGRLKNIVVIENSTFEGNSYEFQLTIIDVLSKENADGGKAMQIFWNRNPVVGVAILKPYNIDRDGNLEAKNAIYRIDYSENKSQTYDAHMIVSIAGLTLPAVTDDPYGVDNLKMFVGKKGTLIDVYGNSNHPNAKFFTEDKGFGWAFVASGTEDKDLAVAEVGLVPSTLNTDSRSQILEDYAIKTVFENQILEAWPDANQTFLDLYLSNTAAPGYFGMDGFIQGGISPGTQYDPLVARIKNLTPYNPSEINNLTLGFK